MALTFSSYITLILGLGNLQVITQPQPQIAVGQHIQQDPSDPTKWQIIPQVTTATAAPQVGVELTKILGTCFPDSQQQLNI